LPWKREYSCIDTRKYWVFDYWTFDPAARQGTIKRMSILLYVASAIVVMAGAAMIGFGIPINEFSFGNTLIIAGTTTIVGGLIIFGLGAAVAQLQRIIEGLTERPERLGRAAQSFEAALPPHDEPPKDRFPTPPRQREGFAPEPPPFEAEPPRHEPPPAPHRDQPVAPPLPNPVEPRAARPELPPFPPRRRPMMPPAPPPPPPPALDESVEAEKREEPSARWWRSTPAPPVEPPPPTPPPAESTNFDDLWPEEEAAPLAQPLRAEPKPDFNRTPLPERPMREAAQPPVEPPFLREAAPRHDTSSPLRETMPPPSPLRDMVHRAARNEAPKAPGEPRAAAILKSGVVDGMGYTLYVDGSIEAELPQGTLRFASIGELREHLEKSS
jgi:hypothetical protein